MSNRADWSARALSLVIAWILVLGGLIAFAAALGTPARAATCDLPGGVITGDWTISTVQTCSGILYTVDGSITVGAGGSLNLINGGLSFAKDTSHAGYALTVNAGGELILDHSLLTTQTRAIGPYLSLAFTVSGAGSRFTMKNGAEAKFPGWFNATGATISLSDSTITGFTSTDLQGVGVWTDANDDGPLISWSSTTATLYRSQIARIYENASASQGNVSGPTEGNISLTAGSTLYAYDSYIGVDYSNLLGFHNELQVDGTSNAYLYNVTIDRAQDPVVEANWQPAYVPLAAGGSIYLLRWMRATVVDSTNFPVSNATIWSIQSPGGATAEYPDNGFLTVPSNPTLTYLGRSSSGTNAWNRTDSNGVAIIPLYTDQITTASLPNANSFGNYQTVVTYLTSTTTGSVYFNPYPSVDTQENNRWVTIAFSTLQVRTGPDLIVRFDPDVARSVVLSQPFDVYAIISNQGQTDATGVSVGVYLDSNTTALARLDGLSLLVGASINRTLRVNGVGVEGSHTLRLVVDPDNTIIEGGAAQENNNVDTIALSVQPPPAGFVAILSPNNNDIIEPGNQIAVTGYVRDDASNPQSGIQVNISLKQGSTLLSSVLVLSGADGFFIGTVTVPSNAQEGAYTVSVTPTTSVIDPDSRTVMIQRAVPFFSSPVPFLGIPWWMFLIILAAAVAVVVGVTMYFRIFGLGKMVECGECGAFIPEDATTCPKCGVEFEKDMAKCSNCQAWIPVDVKQCPECGIEFATGQLDMADYQEKMRLQYDEVVQKFKQEASRQLGRALSEREFQDWWRKQPTFVTYEDWLKEEEDMRKMGSKPCPVCGTLNSVTATVCHKCGSAMKTLARPPGGAGGTVVAGAPQRRAAARSPAGQPPSGEPGEPGAGAAGRSMPPGGPPVVVQKRIVRRPTPEGEQATTEGQEQGEKQEDEL